MSLIPVTVIGMHDPEPPIPMTPLAVPVGVHPNGEDLEIVALTKTIIGRRLAQARRVCGYSLTAAATVAQVPAELLAQVEAGVESAEIAALIAICAVYGLDAAEFLDDVQQEVAPLWSEDAIREYRQANPWLFGDEPPEE